MRRFYILWFCVRRQFRFLSHKDVLENDGRRYSKAAFLDFQIYFTGMGGAAQPRPEKSPREPSHVA